MRVEEVPNQSPPYVDVDLYASDRPLQSAVAANGGERDAAALSAFGKHWGTAEMFDLARAANALRLLAPSPHRGEGGSLLQYGGTGEGGRIYQFRP